MNHTLRYTEPGNHVSYLINIYVFLCKTLSWRVFTFHATYYHTHLKCTESSEEYVISKECIYVLCLCKKRCKTNAVKLYPVVTFHLRSLQGHPYKINQIQLEIVTLLCNLWENSNPALTPVVHLGQMCSGQSQPILYCE